MASSNVVESPPRVASGDEPLFEIVDGRRLELPPMSPYATWIASRLDQRLGPFAEEHSLGTVVTEMLFVLDVDRNLRRRPDVAFVSAERWPLDRALPETGDWQVVPELAVEVISPHDEVERLLKKVHEYFLSGVERVWVVVPEVRQVYVYRSPTSVEILSETDSLEDNELLPAFQLPVATLFRRREQTNTTSGG